MSSNKSKEEKKAEKAAVKEKKRSLKADKKALKSAAARSAKQLKGRRYYASLIKNGSLYKKVNFSFSLMSVVSAFIVIVLLFGASAIFMNEISRRNFISNVESIRESISYTAVDGETEKEKLEMLSEKCVAPAVYMTMDISVGIGGKTDFVSNNPSFEDVVSAAENRHSFDKLDGDEVHAATFSYEGNRFLYTMVNVNSNGDTYVLSAFKNIQINRTYALFFLLTAVVVFLLTNIAVFFTNRAIAINVLMPLTKIADEVKTITEENLAMRIEPLEGEKSSSGSVDTLITALNDMLNRLNIAFTQQQYFVSNVSHELRIPLTIMKGYIDILKSWGRGDEKITDESIKAIDEEIDNMRLIVEGLLLLQSIETGSFEMKMVNINIGEMLNKIADAARILSAEKHEINVKLTKNDIFVDADATLLENAMRAVAENAVKYTPSGGHISFSTEVKKNKVMLIISDDGIGIPREECEKVKERFYRTDTSRDRRIGGNGLGLSMANSSVIAMGGSLDIISDKAQGTKVIITLPLKK